MLQIRSAVAGTLANLARNNGQDALNRNAGAGRLWQNAIWWRWSPGSDKTVDRNIGGQIARSGATAAAAYGAPETKTTLNAIIAIGTYRCAAAR